MSDYELDFWGDCANTLGEELKQLVYARYMGLTVEPGGPGPVINLKGKSVLDIGGGPVSLLLKCVNRGVCWVVDPGDYPVWVSERYEFTGIGYDCNAGEALMDDALIPQRTGWDEAWIYNVLQHVDDPELVLANARKAATLIRIFEWLDVPAYEGHPHELKADDLVSWLGWGSLKVDMVDHVDEYGAVGFAFFGAFPT
jgi:hypothetical protein